MCKEDGIDDRVEKAYSRRSAEWDEHERGEDEIKRRDER